MIDRDRFPVDPWRLVEKSFDVDDAGVTETLFAVANGYLGLRGNHPEGRFAHEHGTSNNGFHETSRSAMPSRRTGSPRSGRPSSTHPTQW